MKREFRYAAASHASLASNEQHQFAARHALAIYAKNAIYTYIPKCGCSTMRYTLAVANGCIADASDADWIHENNETFRATLQQLVACDYAFAVMRCPYRRLASFFLDTVSTGGLRVKSLFARGLLGKAADEVSRATRWSSEAWTQHWRGRITSLSFAAFVDRLAQGDAVLRDHHWAPQTRFLVFRNYDDIFCMERFAEARETLQRRIGLEVIDARSMIRHDTSRYEKIDGEDCSQWPASRIAALKSRGRIPAYQSLYDARTRAVVERLYADDLQFFGERFGRDVLLFG